MAAKTPLKWVAALLSVLAGVAWGVFVFELVRYGSLPVVSLATALAFTAMLAALPFLLGWRLSDGEVRQVPACRECHALLWPADFGFCIRCGAMGPKAGTRRS